MGPGTGMLIRWRRYCNGWGAIAWGWPRTRWRSVLLGLRWLFADTGPMQRLFAAVALSAYDWGRMVLVTASVFVPGGLEKFFLRRREKKDSGCRSQRLLWDKVELLILDVLSPSNE